jgi:SAM-dependent methyltransferase
LTQFDRSSTPTAPTATQNSTWIPQGTTPADHPHMGDDFAKAYDDTGSRITGPISRAALDLAGAMGPNTRILDIAAGAGALSVPAADQGASVLAVDIAPGMVRRLSTKLARFPGCEARVMDGQALELADASFDTAFSILGVSLFPDWRKGLSEQARVVRPGGRGCVATWRKLPGGGPFLVMAQALRTVFPDRPPPAPPEGSVALSDPTRLEDEMRAAGFVDVSVREIEAIWEGPSGEAYLDELKDLHPFMGPYRMLEPRERREVDQAILSIVEQSASNGRVSLHSSVLLAVGTRG